MDRSQVADLLTKRTIERTPDYPHGPSVKWPKVYRGLRRRGFTKEEAARISNEMSAKYRRGRRIPLSRTAGQKPIPEDILDKKPELRKHGTHDQSTHGNWADRINRQLQEEGYHYDFESLRSLFRAALFQAYDTGSDRVTIKIPGGSDFSVPRRMVDAALYEQVTKHGGPGPHESGSEQTEHGRKGSSSETPTAASPSESLAVSVADAPPEDPALVHQTYSQGMKTFGQRLDFIMQVAGSETIQSVDGVARKGDTWGIYGEWDGNDFVRWKPDRAAWQNSVLGQLELEQIEANDGRPPKTDKQVIIMAGLPGSGKTFVLQKQLGQHFDLRDYVVVNADDIKEKIIFDDAPPKIEDLEGLELSTAVHEESSLMAKRWQSDLMRRGTNVALDVTGGNEASTLRRIKSFEDAGYKVHLVHIDVSIEESLASTLMRAGAGSPDGEKLGRPVPPSYIESFRADEGKDVIDRAFPKYAEAANGKVFQFRNYPISRKPPVLTLASA